MTHTVPQFSLSRRRFLQLGAAGAGGLAASPLLSRLEAFAAPPLKTTDPILVVVTLAGGNDSLNMFVPIGDSHYYSLRPNIGLHANQVLKIDNSFGLHPALTTLKHRYDLGQVAIVRGIGYANPDFSHFSSMAYWMQGWGGATQSIPTGWLGRYVDGLANSANESLYSVTLGSSGVPLHLVGKQSRAAGLPLSVSDRFGIQRTNDDDLRLYDGLNQFAARANTGLGKWGDQLAATNSQVMRLTSRIAPAYPSTPPADSFVQQLQLVGRLVNRNLGIRIFSVELDGFDTHTNELNNHHDLFTSLDAGIDTLFKTLSSSWADNVMLMTISEFGRRPEENDGNGTDHGSASTMFVVGPRVKGGMYGQQPGLAPNQLVDYGNLQAHVDFRSAYATVLQKWLGADDKAILGKTYSQLGFVASRP
jgi:uncharacterized protein (DUF1501 family)